MIRPLFTTATLVLSAAALLPAQSRVDRVAPGGADWCRDIRRMYCEAREETIPAPATLDVDAAPNGGITVRGADRGDVQVRARITAGADTEAEARALAESVRITTAGGRIRAEGPPSTSRRAWWSASFDLDVPRSSALRLAAHNGGIAIEAFSGEAQFESVNGGIRLRDVGGDVHGRTVNGGITADLSGARWDGAGLDVETTNGGVRLRLPRDYSAELEAGTTNGGLRIGFPIVVQGNLTRLSRNIVTTLGSGGPRLRLRTVNGAVTIDAL